MEPSETVSLETEDAYKEALKRCENMRADPEADKAELAQLEAALDAYEKKFGLPQRSGGFSA